MANLSPEPDPSKTKNRDLLVTVDPKELGPGVHLVESQSIIVHVSEEYEVRAARNRCRHMGERLSKPRGCMLTCPRHGWVLNASNFTYENPTGDIKQPELGTTTHADGTVEIWESVKPYPWEARPERPELQPGELQVEFFAHACMRVRAGGRTLFTDPWLTGPAFVRGWWLAHGPRKDWLDELAAADAIYISHNHSDHLNEPTLKELARRRTDIPFYVPDFKGESCDHQLHALGFTDVRRVPFNTYVELPGGMRLLIMQDQTDREDSAALIEYRGRRILNAVDCCNLGEILPRPIDVLLSSFAGGASGFPVCWEDLYGPDKVERFVTRNRKTNRRAVMRLAASTAPSVYVPFAGYFTEAHPADHAIKATNHKNTPESICADLRLARPDLQTWIPQPGEVLDLATLEVERAPAEMEFAEREMEPWLAEVRADENPASLATLDGLQRYFDWAGYRGELLLHVLETDESFENVHREFYLETRTGRVLSTRPDGKAPYLRMRVRRDVFHHVLRHGLSWEEISIGFQARFYRAPDTYHFDFWDHFQNRLPETSFENTQRNAA